MNLQIGQIVSQIIAFLIMIWVLKRFAWKPLLKVMEDRKQKIHDEFSAIEKEKEQVQNLKNTYVQKLREIDVVAKAKMQEEIEKARIISKEIEEDAHQQAKLMIKKAKENIESEMADAKLHLKHEIVNLTLAATEKILESGLDRDKYKKLIASRLEEMQLP